MYQMILDGPANRVARRGYLCLGQRFEIRAEIAPTILHFSEQFRLAHDLFVCHEPASCSHFNYGKMEPGLTCPLPTLFGAKKEFLQSRPSRPDVQRSARNCCQ